MKKETRILWIQFNILPLRQLHAFMDLSNTVLFQCPYVFNLQKKKTQPNCNYCFPMQSNEHVYGNYFFKKGKPQQLKLLLMELWLHKESKH